MDTLKVTIDMETLTWRELRELGQLCGRPGVQIMNDFSTGGGVDGLKSDDEYLGLIWIFARRDNPGITFDDVLDSTMMGTEYAPPLPAAGIPSKNGSRPSRPSTRGAARESLNG